MSKPVKLAAIGAASFFAFSVAAPAQTPGLTVLEGLQLGQWTLTPRGSREPGERVCLGDPNLLLQIQHGGADCSLYVIENSPKKLRVSYKCGDLGHGVTPDIDPENVKVLVDTVHEYSAAFHTSA